MKKRGTQFFFFFWEGDGGQELGRHSVGGWNHVPEYWKLISPLIKKGKYKNLKQMSLSLLIAAIQEIHYIKLCVNTQDFKDSCPSLETTVTVIVKNKFFRKIIVLNSSQWKRWSDLFKITCERANFQKSSITCNLSCKLTHSCFSWILTMQYVSV